MSCSKKVKILKIDYVFFKIGIILLPLVRKMLFFGEFTLQILPGVGRGTDCGV